MTNSRKTWRVKHQRPIEYEVANCPDIFNPENHALVTVGRHKNSRRFIIVDQNVHAHFSQQIDNYFDHHSVDARTIVFPSGEKNKTIDSYLWLLRELDNFPINRRDEPIIAIGGGVLTDTAAFVAASYRRGVPHIKVPTTLMGYVDAAIGVKAGINFNGYKNRLGAFEPPKKVLLDRNFLKTLPQRHVLNGMCEIIKLAIIKDYELFELLEQHGRTSIESRFQDDFSASILDHSVGGMLEELEPNLFEDELARKVDFGHTFSYGLETHLDTELLHGEAVMIDILISSLLANLRSLLSDENLNRIFDLVSVLGISFDDRLVTPGLLWKTLEERLYHRNGMQRVPLPQSIGGCTFVNDVQYNEIETACKLYKERKTHNEPVY